MIFQAKADEIAKLMNENEQLKAVIEDLKVGSFRYYSYSLLKLQGASVKPQIHKSIKC